MFEIRYFLDKKSMTFYKGYIRIEKESGYIFKKYLFQTLIKGKNYGKFY